jgi:hypothetical protein
VLCGSGIVGQNEGLIQQKTRLTSSTTLLVKEQTETQRTKAREETDEGSLPLCILPIGYRTHTVAAMTAIRKESTCGNARMIIRYSNNHFYDVRRALQLLKFLSPK